ncbi:hypothetical protein P153DRAFT_384916 [Dothidotthia symphoricarpi CBS 119687]|uniref:Uncharacterized protein n=1 Tax=Dothidotthia symphoricarpi CBS 119687 TaxID=1392245 RepID=A0A6A6AIC4_9PLEO|nr:uncharacterized protein P153DRAFT_384916 [Dothidotthia symphoricarpi CBS 119687]KAF2130657.1 hypothetical protein P153DRAFT_384916 [Dothidotthia symphoricarpi CBS 119687]
MNATTTTPHTPTARKYPTSSQGSSTSQQKGTTTPSGIHKSPTIQQASKVVGSNTPLKAQQGSNTVPSDAPTPAQKRKWEGAEWAGKLTLPKKRSRGGKNQGADVPMAQMLPQKKPLTEDGESNSETPNPVSTTNPSTTTKSSTPSQMFIPAQELQVPNANTTAHFLFTCAIHNAPSLIPNSPYSNPISSLHVDNIANAMWQVAFAHQDGVMLQQVCMYCAMYSELKLRALAKLNFLPSWWFLREMAVCELHGQGWMVDDAVMQGTWVTAVAYCQKIMGAQGKTVASHGEHVMAWKVEQ